MMRCAGIALVLTLGAVSPAGAQSAETLGEVRVHGNHTTPDAEVLSIAGLTVGAPVSDQLIQEAESRLNASGRFDNVELRKRFRSLENPNDVLIIILVDEVTGISSRDLTPGPMRKLRSLGMWLPVLNYSDGYGFTYGARVTFVDVMGQRSRLSFPLTWGGERRASIEVDRSFTSGPITRLEGAVSINRRVNPHFDIADTRREVRARAERAFTAWLRVGGAARFTNVSFGGIEESYLVPSVDVTLDTRLDPAYPRNAVHATATLERLQFDAQPRAVRWTTDVRGFVGLFGSSVLALRAANVNASRPVAPFEQALLGGAATLRGYDFGYRAGDNLSVLSAEVRVPITSPLSVGRFGLKAFIDAGTVYPHGAKLSDQRLDRGVGGGIFMSWAVLRMGLDVAWPVSTESNKPRWHFGLGVTF
jgi:hypothetical protein